MKFIYVDESGGSDQSDVFVMCGLMVDAYKLRKKTADVAERLNELALMKPSDEFELKTKNFLEGKRGWNKIDGLTRQKIISNLIEGALEGGSEIFAIGVSFEKYKRAMETDVDLPFCNNYWVGAAMFIISLIQKKMQAKKDNKGHTVFIVDDNKTGTTKLSDALYRCDPWFDGLYQQRKKVRNKQVWVSRNQDDRFDQIINTAFGIKSNNSSLVQVADAMSYVYRRHLELQNDQEKYDGEKQYFSQLVGTMDNKRAKIGIVPKDARCVKFYRKITHPNWQL